jgi:hypothetical protein
LLALGDVFVSDNHLPAAINEWCGVRNEPPLFTR